MCEGKFDFKYQHGRVLVILDLFTHVLIQNFTFPVNIFPFTKNNAKNCRKFMKTTFYRINTLKILR